MRLTLLNKKGIGIVEVLLVTVITGLLMGSIFYLLSVAQSSRALSTAKSEVQSEVRRAMDWIVNDVRQTINSNIGSVDNEPSSTHIKFQKVTGYGTLSSNFIEYTYDLDANTITRTDPGTDPYSWTFRNIIQAPFYTRKQDGSIVVIEPTGDNSLLETKNLVIEIKGQKQVNSILNTIYILKGEVRIRNNG